MTLINCDLGECLTPDPDEIVMPLINMANIASGGHAGDTASIRKTIDLAKRYSVTVGAHPSYDDKANFGRISHFSTTQALFDSLQQQIRRFTQICEAQKVEMHYIKPHGALYHDMMHKPEVLDVLCDLIKQENKSLSLVVQAGINQARMHEKSASTKIHFIYEAFADRAYRDNQLVPRTESGAMLLDAKHIVDQYHSFSTQATFPVDTVCFHSDHPASVAALQLIKGN